MTTHTMPYQTKYRGNPDVFGRVAVLFGGTSAEREISLQSGGAVLAGLQALGVDAFAVDVQNDVVAQLQSLVCDRAFIALHGAGGEDGKIQALLEWLNIPYTGSGIAASAVGLNKVSTKLQWQGAGLPTPLFALLNDHSDIDETLASLGGNCFIKPASEGSSIGMQRVDNSAGMAAAYKLAKQYDAQVFAEKTIVGREFTVAVLNEQTLPSIELIVKNAFYDYDAKYLSDDTRYECPSHLIADEERYIRDMALQAFRVLGCRGWGRIDFMRDDSGKFYLLEANTVPGMTSHSLVPMAAKAAGLDFNTLLTEILASTLTEAAC